MVAERSTEAPDEIEALASRWAASTQPAGLDEGLSSPTHWPRWRLGVTRMQVMVVGFIANAALLALAASMSLVDGGVVFRYAAAVAMLLGASWLVARSGLDAGPLQWLALIAPGMVAMYELGNTASRGAFLLLSLAPLAYEMLELSKRRFIVMALIYALSYAGMLYLLNSEHPERLDLRADKLIAFALAGLVIIIGGMRARMHESLNVTRRRSDELRLALSTMAHVAEHDALTSVVNRRFLTTLMEMLTQRARRSGQAYSVAMMDVDHFKAVNDNHGHLVGDSVLQRVAQVVSADLRASDAFGRWGGEEFLLVMPDTPLLHARSKTEQLRTLVARIDWSDIAPGLKVTVSAGVTQWKDGERVEAVIARVDAALYAAKHHGRNRVEFAPGET